MPQTLFTCPIEPCDWQYIDDSLNPPDNATPDDLEALHTMHYEVIQSELLAHYETHPVAACTCSSVARRSPAAHQAASTLGRPRTISAQIPGRTPGGLITPGTGL